jgi:hypothetical protein
MGFHGAEIHARNRYGCGLRHTSRMKDGIVMNYNYAITRRMDVELDSFGPKLERPLEGRYRVLGERFVRAAVRDFER